jgi:hypothetical protein
MMRIKVVPKQRMRNHPPTWEEEVEVIDQRTWVQISSLMNLLLESPSEA